MDILTKEELNFVEKHIDTIKKIVVTSACSVLSPDYLEGLKDINRKYHFTQCVTCNSSIFLATNSLYKYYLYTKEKEENNDGSKEKRNSRKGSKTDSGRS